MLSIKAKELEQWAEQYRASFEFPILLSRLIWATCPDVQRLNMRTSEHTYLSGFDGIVECSRGNSFVPAGLSAWEISTDKRVTAKADKDYDDRTQSSGNITQDETTFIYATPCRWSKCNEWKTAKNAENIWKEVRGLWSSDLEKWLDTAPWIAISFARNALGKHITGLQTIEMIWNDYADIPHPSYEQLSHDFVLSGREQTRGDFIGWLMRDILPNERILLFSGPSEKEILHFIAATIHSLDEPDCTKLGSRIIAIDDIESALSLRGVTAEHTILATGDVIPHAVRLSRASECRVIIFHTNDNDFQSLQPINSIKLLPMTRDAMIRAVLRLGFHYSVELATRICEENSFDYERVRRTIFLY
jgi:hypothetical protein